MGQRAQTPSGRFQARYRVYAVLHSAPTTFATKRDADAFLAAATGASTKELMARMGHASPRAALIYQHAVRERDVAIAGALSDAIQRVLEKIGTVSASRELRNLSARGANDTR